MHDLSIMMDEIWEDEILDLECVVDPELMKRAEEHVLAYVHNNTVVDFTEKKKKKRRFLPLILVAVLVFGGALTATATVRQNWDMTLLEFIGINQVTADELADYVVDIDTTAVCDGQTIDEDGTRSEQRVNMIVMNSIGDRHAAFLKIETDYPIPADFNPETDYYMVESQGIEIHQKGEDMPASWSAYLAPEMEDGHLCFLMHLGSEEDLSSASVRVKLQNLVLYHDLGMSDPDAVPEQEPELVYEGTWNLSWDYDFQTRRIAKKLWKTIYVNGKPLHLTSLEVTPIGVYFTARSNPLRRHEILTVIGQDEWGVEAITYRDGTVVHPEFANTSEGIRNSYLYHKELEIISMGEVIHLDQVKSVTIAGTEIMLR